MKNVKTMIIERCEKLDAEWQKLPAGKQKKWVIVFFTGYLLITGCVVFKVWYDAKNDALRQNSDTGRIINPFQQQKKHQSLPNDSLLNIQKNKDYERK